jgi:periplasmic protein CpxP/Spy
MKKQLLAAGIALFSITAVNAQDNGNFQRRTPEERVQAVHAKLDSAFKLDADKLKQVDEIFLNSYKDQDKKMDELRAGGAQPDRDAMMAARDKIVAERDAKLKGILTEEQMKTWKDQIEPSLRPQRPNGAPQQ